MGGGGGAVNPSFDTLTYNQEADAAPETRSRYSRAECERRWERVADGPNPDCTLGPRGCQRQWTPDGRCAGCAGVEVQAQ